MGRLGPRHPAVARPEAAEHADAAASRRIACWPRHRLLSGRRRVGPGRGWRAARLPARRGACRDRQGEYGHCPASESLHVGTVAVGGLAGPGRASDG